MNPRLSAQLLCHVPCRDLGRRRPPTLSHSQAWLWISRLQDFLHHLLKSLFLPQPRLRLAPRPIRLLQPFPLHLQTYKFWWMSGKRRSSPGCRLFFVTLHLSQQWVPLFHGLCATTHCGSWVPLMILKHHGPNVRPVQNEPTDAPGFRALQVMGQGQVETDGLSRDNAETPVPHRPLRADDHLCLNSWEQTVLALFVALALRMTAGEALTLIVAKLPLSHPSAVIAVLLLPLLNDTIPGTVPLSPVGTLRPAWLGDLLGTTLCLREAVLLLTQLGDHPGAVTRPLGPDGRPQSPAPLLHL